MFSVLVFSNMCLFLVFPFSLVLLINLLVALVNNEFQLCLI